MKTPPIAVARPSARSTLPMSEALIRLPTISPVAMVLPVDSTAVISSTMIIVRQATTSNLGMPNRNGWVKPIAEACADLVEVHVAEREGDRAADHQPEQHGDGGDEPAEQSLDRDDDRDGADARRAASAGSSGRSRRCAGWSPRRERPTGTRHNPMMVISVPVTTGGKNRSSLTKIGAIRNVKTPATITAPYT